MPALDLDDPTAVLLAAVDAFEQAGLQVAAYGGLILAAYGEPRETRDADLAVAHVSCGEAIAALRAAGLDVTSTFEDVRFGGNTLTRVTLIGGGALNTVDLVTPRSNRFAELVVSRSVRGQLRGRALSIVTPEDFVLLKILSTRDRDLEDARSVVGHLGDALDRSQIADEGTVLADEIPDHDVLGRLTRVLAP